MDSYIVGIAGGTGSGKTTLVRRLLERLGKNAVLMEHDAYYNDLQCLSVEERENQNFDHPSALQTPLLIEHLKLLKGNRAVDMPLYDFSLHRRRPETRKVQPGPVIILEGILVLADAGLREHIDLKVFVETGADLRFIRRLQRDLKDRGRSIDSVVRQYLDTVRPMHLQYVEPSKEYADITVLGEKDLGPGVDLILERLSPVLGESVVSRILDHL